MILSELKSANELNHLIDFTLLQLCEVFKILLKFFKLLDRVDGQMFINGDQL